MLKIQFIRIHADCTMSSSSFVTPDAKTRKKNTCVSLSPADACKPTGKENTKVTVSGFKAKSANYFAALETLDNIKGPILSVVKETVEELSGKQKD